AGRTAGKEKGVRQMPGEADSLADMDMGAAAPEPALAMAEEMAPAAPPRSVMAKKAERRMMGNSAGIMAQEAYIAPAKPASIAPPQDDSYQQQYKDEGRDQFEHKEQNPVKLVSEESVSTFSIDVDTAS